MSSYSRRATFLAVLILAALIVLTLALAMSGPVGA